MDAVRCAPLPLPPNSVALTPRRAHEAREHPACEGAAAAPRRARRADHRHRDPPGHGHERYAPLLPRIRIRILTRPHLEGADVLLRTLPLGSLIVKILPLFTTPLARGGDPSLFAAAAPAVRARADEFRGAYLMPVGKIAQPSRDARDVGLAGELWATSEAQLAALGL